jgi:hypothetical protein
MIRSLAERAPFGTCYTASSIEVAFAESVIHESGRFVGGSYEVPAAELTERSSCALRVSGARHWCWLT